MSVPTLKDMLAKYASDTAVPIGPDEHPFDYSMNLPVSKHFPGCIAYIAFIKQITAGLDPNLDDLSENITLGFIRLLKGEVREKEFQSMCWDLREWLGWLHENAYTWVDLGTQIEVAIGMQTKIAA